MTLDGQRGRRFPSPAAASDAGIVCVFQELSLVPDLSGRRQHRHPPAADALRHDRPPRAAPDRRGGAGARRRRGHPSAARWSRTCRCRAGRWSRSPRRWRSSPRILILDEATSALTAADVAKVFAVLKRLRAEGLALRLHLAPHARDRRARRRLHGVPQRPQRRDLRGRDQVRPGSGRDDDRPRVQPRLPAAHRPRRARREPVLGLPRPELDRPAARHLASRSAAARWSGSAASTGRASANCCSRSSACCATSTAPSRSPAGRSGSPSPARRRAAIGMALIPEDRKTEGLMLPMTVRREPVLRRLRPHRAARDHRPAPPRRC